MTDSGARTDAVDALLEEAEGLSDAERLEAIGGLAEQVNASKLPHHQRDRVTQWRDKARSAATAAEGPEPDTDDEGDDE